MTRNPGASTQGVSPPLHVLLSTDVVGGVWDFCLTLACGLSRLGHRATLLAFGEPTERHQQAASSAGAWLISRPLKLEWMQDSSADVREAQRTAERFAAELDVDVLHANQFVLGSANVDVPVVLTAHSDVLSWLRWTMHDRQRRAIGPEWVDYAELVRRGLRHADRVVAISGFLAEEVRALYGIERGIQVIHNGWPPSTRRSRPVHRRERLTVLAGRAWDRAKNFDLARVAAQGWDVGRVVLAGDCRHPETGDSAAVGPPVEAAGVLARSEMDALLATARVALSPARYDPFGLVPLQAALAGCALLLSDIPSYRELWGGTATYFAVDDRDGLRERWRGLLDDGERASAIASAARQRALERFDSARMVDDYLQLYRQAQASRAARSRPRVVA